jgi:hypothetical protein
MVTLAYLAGIGAAFYFLAAAADMPYGRAEWQEVADDWRWRIAVRAERLAALRSHLHGTGRVTAGEYAFLGLRCAAHHLHRQAWRLLEATLSRTDRSRERNRT